MFGSASQGGEQADQLYFGMLVSLLTLPVECCRIFTKIFKTFRHAN